MIVDDDPDGRFFTQRSLKRGLGECRIIECSSAEEALHRLEDMLPDAIVTDHHLGGKSGCDFIGELRDTGMDCPLILVTYSDNPEIPRRAYHAGATKVFRAGGNEFVQFLKTVLSVPDAD